METQVAAIIRRLAVRPQPFPHVVIPDLLPTEQWQALLDTFPAADAPWRSESGGKLQLPDLHVPKVLDGPWASLIGTLADDVVITTLVRALAPEIADRVDANLATATDRGGQFSRFPRGAELEPHNDGPSKVLSLLYYLGPSGWDPTWGGGTSFHAPHSRLSLLRWRRFDGSHVPAGRAAAFERDWPIAVTVPFVPNTLLAFSRSSRTYHSVAAHDAPGDHERLSFNFNVIWREV